MEVTARELKLRLGRFLAIVRAGETVRVTLRGKPVAEIRPIPPPRMTRLDLLIAEGRARAGKGNIGPHTPQPFERSPSEIILADREDEYP